MVYCYNKNTGELIWKFKTKGKIEGSPVITKKTVLIASGDGRIYQLNLETGMKIWSYEIGRAIVSTPAVINNMIVVTSMDGRIYAFGKK